MKTAVRKAAASLFAGGTLVMSLAQSAFAQFGGVVPTIDGLTDETGGIKEAIVRVVTAVLNFLALIAVIVIIIAGIRLIVSQGEEEQKDKAKKTIFYALIGLVVVLLARVVVGFVTVYLSEQPGI